jgi:hypothetical protein
MLERKNKSHVCPACLKSYSRYDKIINHCNAKVEEAKEKAHEGKDKAHEGLAAQDFSTFHSTYKDAIGWKVDAKDLRLPSTRAACFELPFVIQHMTFLTPKDDGKKLAILIKIAEESGMKYICPLCPDSFDTPSSLNAHCRYKGDSTHRGLVSTDTSTFLPCYWRAMGCEFDDPPLGLDRKGPRSFHECFKTGYAVKKMEKWSVSLE